MYGAVNWMDTAVSKETNNNNYPMVIAHLSTRLLVTVDAMVTRAGGGDDFQRDDPHRKRSRIDHARDVYEKVLIPVGI